MSKVMKPYRYDFVVLAPGRNRHSEAERKRQFRAIKKNQCTSFSFL